jgi:hypothetical protein
MSDVRPPQDDRYLHHDPGALARANEAAANDAWVRGNDDAYMLYSDRAREFRRMEAEGDKVPRF